MNINYACVTSNSKQSSKRCQFLKSKSQELERSAEGGPVRLGGQGGLGLDLGW